MSVPEKIEIYSFLRFVIPGYVGTLMFLYVTWGSFEINMSIIVISGLVVSISLGTINRILGITEIPMWSSSYKWNDLKIFQLDVQKLIHEFTLKLIFGLLGHWYYLHLRKLQNLIRENLDRDFAEDKLVGEHKNIWPCMEKYKYWQDAYVEKNHAIGHSYSNYYWFLNISTSSLFICIILSIFLKKYINIIVLDTNMFLLTIVYLCFNLISLASALKIINADRAIVESNKRSLRKFLW